MTGFIYRTPTVTSIGGRDGSVRSADGLIDLQLAFDRDGNRAGKTNPEELFAASYAASFHSSVKRVAADSKHIIGNSTVEAHVGVNPDLIINPQMFYGSSFMLTVDLHVTLPAVDAETAASMVREAHRICPYSNATRNNVDVNLSVTTIDGNEHRVF